MSGKFSGDGKWRERHGDGIAEDDVEGVCVIAYSGDYVEGMNYFRSVVRHHDLSPHVMDLLDHLLAINPANYSVWHYRRILLASLAQQQQQQEQKGAVYKKELEYVSEMAEAHPKNYQIWYHRQVIMSILFPVGATEQAKKELDFVATIFEDDAKNYHAWTYRQWIITHYKLWDQEPGFTDDLINKDIRNNSAWNQRYFVFSKGPKNFADQEVLKNEIRYGISKIGRTPNNESAWNYLRGIVNESYKAHPEIKEFCVGLKGRGVLSPHLLSTLADIAVEEGRKEDALELFDLLEKNVDTIHKKYWEYRKAQVSM